MKYFTKIPMEKEYKPNFEAKHILIGEDPNQKVLKKIGNAFFNEKVSYEYDLKRRLKQKKVLLIFPVRIKQYSKKYRILDIKSAYISIKNKIRGNPNIILLHDYVEEAIGEFLRKEFKKVYDVSYLISYDKFKKELLKCMK